MPPGSEVGDEYDSDDVPYLVHGGDDAGDGGGDLVTLLNGGDGRVEVPTWQRLLHRYEDAQKKNKYLKEEQKN